MRMAFAINFVFLNEYIREERAHRMKASKIKKELTEAVAWLARAEHLTPVTEYPVRIRFTWRVKDTRTDPDNVRFAAKYVLDGLVSAGVLRDDGMSEIECFEDYFVVVDIPHIGVAVEIENVAAD